MAKAEKQQGKNIFSLVSKVLLTVLLATLAGLATYHLLYWQKVYPGVTVAGVYVGGKTENETATALANISAPQTIIFIAPSQEFTLYSSQINLSFSSPQTAKSAFQVGRSGNLIKDTRDKLFGIIQDKEIPLAINYNQSEFDDFLANISETLFAPSIKPQVAIEKGQAVVEVGKSGQEVDINLLTQNFQNAAGRKENIVLIPINIKEESLTGQEANELASRAKKIVGKSITFSLDQNELTLQDSELAGFLTAGNRYDEEKIMGWVEKLASQFSRPAQEPTFKFEEGKVLEFTPARDGLAVNTEKLKEQVILALSELEQASQNQTVAVTAKREKPRLATADVNNLGIKELIGKATSRFRGSAASRVYNIGLAASRLNGIIIPPGETFSFNTALGDVSPFTGYQQAYIIKEGKTILGDGGGVCQVSSTLFRAALATGLPIPERQAHSYRVSYYELDSGPGFDATIYSPSPDFKIKNDTPAHILIQTNTDKKNMTITFEFYGTSDGRVATTTKPRVWDQVSPPEDLYQDDPTLAAGVVKQVNSKAWGAKVAFDYSVVRGNEQLQKRTFYSNYRPWAATYLRGITPQ